MFPGRFLDFDGVLGYREFGLPTPPSVKMAVYLDNSATTPLDPEVLEVMLPYLRGEYGNASSIHSFGQRARTAVEEAREKIADFLGASPREIVFTSGGTESDNLAIRGVVEGRRSERLHIITSSIEHPAVLNTCETLENENVRVTYLPVDEEARINVEVLGESIDDETVLISIMHANNETGTIQDICQIAQIAHANDSVLHSDGVQSFGKLPIDVKKLGVDLFSFSAHKIHGPKGIGGIYIRSGLAMRPILFGGHQERSRRPGTENVAAIVGFGHAACIARRRLQNDRSRIAALRDRLETGLRERVNGVRINGKGGPRLPNISNVSFELADGEALTVALDLEGIAVSTGSACSSGSLEPSHVLLAMGYPKEDIQGSLRFSLSRMTTDWEITQTLDTLPRIVERLRSYAPEKTVSARTS